MKTIRALAFASIISFTLVSTPNTFAQTSADHDYQWFQVTRVDSCNSNGIRFDVDLGFNDYAYDVVLKFEINGVEYSTTVDEITQDASNAFQFQVEGEASNAEEGEDVNIQFTWLEAKILDTNNNSEETAGEDGVTWLIKSSGPEGCGADVENRDRFCLQDISSSCTYQDLGNTCLEIGESCSNSEDCCSGYCDADDPNITASAFGQCFEAPYWDEDYTPPHPFIVCENIPHEEFSQEFADCETCMGNNGLWTAIGCINYSPEGFAINILQLASFIAGGFALLLIIYGAFTINTSAGNPEQVQKGKEIIGSAIAGLLFILFSVVLLNLIGVEVLQLPGF